MKIGISTASFYGKQETEKAVNTIKGFGADCAEIFLQTFYEYRPEFAKSIAPAICGFDVHSVHVLPFNFEPQLFFDSRRSRGDGFYWLDQVMRSAQLLCAGDYTFHGFVRKAGQVDDFDALSAYIRGVIEFCSRYSVKLCLENVCWSLYNRPGVFRELKARISGLSGVFDIKQARKSGYPYPMYLKDMEGSIAHIHLSDVNGCGNTCLPGEGVLNFSEVFKRLKDVGFNGAVLIEAEQFADIVQLKRSLEFVKETVYKIY